VTPRRLAPAVAGASLLLAACGGGGGETERPDALEDRRGLTPVYDTTTSTPRAASTTSAVGSASSTATTSPPRGGAPEDDRPTATITDRIGDATRALGGQPAWADLAAAELTRHEEYLELRVGFGDRAPSSSGSADATMNVATFFDVDGDGQVDYEVWANLADGGWDASWFDNREGTAAFSEDAAIDVVVVRDELVVRFPPQYVGAADSFRWSLASEYGTYALLGTSQTARDDAPDDDQAAAFPR
jgi:hypothetical protein